MNDVKKLILFLVTFLLVSTAKAEPREKYKIGFSQCTMADQWRQTQVRLMEIELAFYPEMNLVVRDAQDDNETQIRQIEEFLNEGIDLLIVSPNESAPLTPVVEKVFQSGIPVIVLDRTINTENYTAFISGDNYTIGVEAGNYAARLLKGSGKILEITGLEGSSPAIERHRGFVESLHSFSGIEIVKSVSGEWNWNKARQLMQEIVNSGLEFDLVFAHNDLMAREAHRVLRELVVDHSCFFLGIDGLPGNEGGIQFVIDQSLDATFSYPTGGGAAIQTAYQILTGGTFGRNTILPTMVIDSANAKILRMQTDQIELLQQKIEKQKTFLDIQTSQNQFQRMILIFLTLLLALGSALAVMIFLAFRSKKRANLILETKNHEIEKQNQAISEQRDKLIEVSKQLEEATQAKLRFYTNISHEFRTPLTLIKGPLENLMESGDCNADQQVQFRLMHRNTERLLRLVNQLMDFRKLENKKMELSASEHDLVVFLGEIRESFASLAASRNIDFSVIAKEPSLKVWFDYDKIDKVFFNILSNAFKFTSDGGSITMLAEKTESPVPGIHKEEVQIEIRDTGTGIATKHLDKIFDRFYQTDRKHSARGTGLGLNLSREFVEMHRGRLTVKSAEGKGTSFFVFLPLGTLHFKEDELVREEQSQSQATRGSLQGSVVSAGQGSQVEEEKIAGHRPESSPATRPQGVKMKPGKEGESEVKRVILIVEDDTDVRQFIRLSLGNLYRIEEAQNGQEGWERTLEEEPDLIISDVMMPLMDGLELTRKLKSDLKTCHIPVILLTARATMEHKLEGLEEGADSYISKPFNSRHLQVRVKKLLELRASIREHYKTSLDFQEIEPELNRLDKKFLNKLTQIIEENIGKEDLSVEELGQKAGMSRVHLYRKIKKLTDLSVSEFVTSVKLKKSLELLRSSGKSVAEIAYEVGFSSPSYFTRCFRERFKLSPSEYSARDQRKELP